MWWKRFLVFLLVVSVWVWQGCGGESAGTGLENPEGSGGGAIPKVTILRPSPCQRIRGDLTVTVSATDDKKISNVHITINDILYIDFAEAPYSRTLPSGMLPADGTYTLRAIAYDNDGNSNSAEVEIRIDLNSPFLDNILVVDADADPLELGGSPGAVFRINPQSGTVCTLASSNKFVDPSGITVGSNGYIYVTDRSADLDGTGSGIGGVFLVLPDRLNYVEAYAVSSSFKSPWGIDVATDGALYVADSGVEPAGAIFKVGAMGAVSTVVAGNLDLLHPVGVTVDASGDLWIVDVDASPLNPPGSDVYGSVWRYNATGPQPPQ